MDVYQVAKHIGLDPEQITGTETLSTRHGHRIWRVHTHDGSFVLKWFPDTLSAAGEIYAYRLLQDLGVPTLPVYHRTEQGLLLADLYSSPLWRLAGEDDVQQARVGAAIGRWYRVFHQQGAEFIGRQEHEFELLPRESDALTVLTMDETARALGLMGNDVWKAAKEALPLLKNAESSLGCTLNYHDFHWTNLALSRADNDTPEAVIFDYHLLGVGMRYNDCRNVTWSLGAEATAAFWHEYGSVDPREAVIDQPLSTLYSLMVAAKRPQFPGWAQESLIRVTSGLLLRDLDAAIDLAEGML